MSFKIEGKEMYPIFVFVRCCWSVHSMVVRRGKHAHSKQRKATPTQPRLWSQSLRYFGWLEPELNIFRWRSWSRSL